MALVLCFKSKIQRCPHGGSEPQYGSGLEYIIAATASLLKLLYIGRESPNKRLSLDERNHLIRTRYSAGETLMELASAFGISFQRVSILVRKIIHQFLILGMEQSHDLTLTQDLKNTGNIT